MFRLKGSRSSGLTKKIILFLIVILFVLVLSKWTTKEGGLDTFDTLYYDLWHILAGPRAEPKQVAIVTIDNETLFEYRDEPLVFWGPRFARGIDVLRIAGVNVIGRKRSPSSGTPSSD